LVEILIGWSGFVGFLMGWSAFSKDWSAFLMVGPVGGFLIGECD